MNNKPYTYLWSWCVLFLVTASMVVDLVVAFINIGESASYDSSGLWMLAGPFIITWLVQLVLLLAVSWWVLQQAKAWKTWAILVAAVVTPFVSLFYITKFFEVIKHPINNAGNPVVFYLLAALIVFAGTIAYYDLKYRKPVRGVE